MKKTVVIGASPNVTRYSNMAVQFLKRSGFDVVPLGIRRGEIAGEKIVIGKPAIENVHTVTLYIGPDKQEEYYNYILSLHPERVIFNPGTENQEFIDVLQQNYIDVLTECTLVMVNLDNF